MWLRETQTSALLRDLDDGIPDAAVMTLPTGHPGLVERKLVCDPFLLAGSPQQIARVRGRTETSCPATLNPDRLLLLDEGHCLADQALDVCQLDRSAIRVDLGVSSLTTLCGLVAAGGGMAFLPALAWSTVRAAAPDLATIPFAAPAPERPLGLLRKACVPGGAWFDDLARVLTTAA